MQNGWSYIKDSGDFINKTINLSTTADDAILFTADRVGFCLSMPYEVGLRALREALDKQDKNYVPTEDSVKMEEVMLKNNFFEFKQQVSGTAIGTEDLVNLIPVSSLPMSPIKKVSLR